jgi:DNA invertase Pin-like site-specific DNA recombinase
MTKLIGYVRVSRIAGREGDSFISPDVQRERIEAHARRMDMRSCHGRLTLINRAVVITASNR